MNIAIVKQAYKIVLDKHFFPIVYSCLHDGIYAGNLLEENRLFTEEYCLIQKDAEKNNQSKMIFKTDCFNVRKHNTSQFLTLLKKGIK